MEIARRGWFILLLVAGVVASHASAAEKVIVGSPLEVGRLSGTPGAVLAIAVTPDGKTAISAGADLSVRVWDIQPRKCKAMLRGHFRPVLAVAITPDGRRAVTGGQDNRLCVWDLETKQLLSMTKLTGHAHGVAISNDGKIAAAGTCMSGQLVVVDVDKDAPLFNRDLPGSSFAVGVNADGSHILAAAITRAENGRRNEDKGRIIGFSKDGDQTFEINDVGFIDHVTFLDEKRVGFSGSRHWGDFAIEQPAKVNKHDFVSGTVDAAIPADAKYVYTVSMDNACRLPIEARGKYIDLPACQEWTRAVACSADGNLVLVGGGGMGGGLEGDGFYPGRDTDIRIIDPRKPMKAFARCDESGNSFAISPDKKYLAKGEPRLAMQIINLANGRRIMPKKSVRSYPHGYPAVYSKDGKFIYFYSPPGTREASRVEKIDAIGQNSVQSWEVNHQEPSVMVVSPDEHYCLVARSDVPSGQLRNTPLDPDDKDVRVIDLTTGKLLPDFPTGKQAHSAMAINPDSSKVVIAFYTKFTIGDLPVDERRTVQVWDIAGGKKLHEFDTPLGSSAVAMSDQLVAAESRDKVLLWDAKTGQALPPIEGVPGQIKTLYFRKGGSQLIVLAGGVIYLIDVKTHDLITQYDIAANANHCDLHLAADGSLYAALWNLETTVYEVPLPK